MSSRVTLAQVVDGIALLSRGIDPDEFIYDFLACFGLPKATIARLKGGGLNVAKKEGATLLKTKVYFEPIRTGLFTASTPMQAIEAAQKDSRIAANKPRFLIATDFKTLAAYDTKRKEAESFPIGDLHEHYTFFLPLAGMEKSTVHAEAEADVKAAEHMAKLYDLIRADNSPKNREERHALNVFLTRLLFCYFAEDTGIFPQGSFTGAVESYTQTDGSDLPDFLRQLFITLNTGPNARGKTLKHLVDFPYVNGGLFSDNHARQSAVPLFSTKSRQKLIELGTKSWREINPDIFGSMFQGVVDEEMRAELGMHYTSVPNIMKVIRPLFLDELYVEFEKTKGSESRLNKLLARIYRLRIFDPACGSGNFLIIAYKELRRLEMAIYKELLLLTGQLPFSFSGIQVSQFYGIELDDFAHEVAILALWLTEHQMNIEFAAAFEKTPASLPLKDGAKIVCGDATILDWDNVCPINDGFEVFVIGNPPYLGARNQDEITKEAVFRCYNGSPEHRDADLISCWFIKGAAYISGKTAQLAFVTTNSVCQGDHVAILWPRVLGNGLEIHFAHTSFKWSNSAKNNAAVSLVTAEEPKFNEALRRYLYVLRGDGETMSPKIRHVDKEREMDIFATRRDVRNDVIENIVVELKHPNVRLGGKELNQVDLYQGVILKQPEFTALNMHWTFILVGREFDTSGKVERAYESALVYGEKYLTQKNPSLRSKVLVKRWSDVFSEFECRHNFILEKLEIDKLRLIDEMNKTKNAAKVVSSASSNLAAESASWEAPRLSIGVEA